jgi:hypothetical protein
VLAAIKRRSRAIGLSGCIHGLDRVIAVDPRQCGTPNLIERRLVL